MISESFVSVEIRNRLPRLTLTCPAVLKISHSLEVRSQVNQFV